ncbi:MAG: HD domain-containing protein [Candidatus Omnitrophica bacterium]|nr:HD domain-containing protein [Candidatus Omnitrophota bacterium]
MEKKFIKELKAGDRFESVFQLKKKESSKTKDGKPFLKLTVSDKTGSIEAKIWDNAEEFDQKIDTGMAILARGSVDSWKDNLQLKMESVRPASSGEYNIQDLVRTVENIDELWGKVEGYLSGISNKWISSLARSFLDDKDFMEGFKRSPGASSWHNAYIGGLLEHTYEIMFIVDKTCDLYPEANRDIAIIGAFLHDIGKMTELDVRTFEYTVSGGLIGHLPLGFEMLSRKISSVEGFPQDLAIQLKHIILSHHGEYEQQSPVLPKTLEATIVYHSDELVSQANAVKEIMRSQAPSGRDWSNFITIKERKYFLKKPEEK